VIPRIKLDETALLVVDLQPKLLPLIHSHEPVTEQCVRLIRGCVALGVPVLATEQNPEKLGATVEPVASVLPDDCDPYAKMLFSACVKPIMRQLGESGRRTVLVCGIESHVCVMQTAFDLIAAGYIAAVPFDAVGSRRPADFDAARLRMTGVGVVPVTVEMALLEMVREAGIDAFRAILPIIK